ncbi:aminoglycoside phosphotransferase family protein [Nocardiopsis sp. NPDC058789]|uniref:aminoglycoside phosphotransferase family protein n=1 Tax=Nocardiopsis sp. NPDC058789 TaxID=3346634 RepID=UPI003672DA48
MDEKALVRTLLEEQHPDLSGLALREVEGGWDNRMWRLGEDLAVRMPRSPRAPELLRAEHRWLPDLAPRLPLPVPVPMRLGAPSARFPNLWSVTTWVSGHPADLAPVTRGTRALAAFLTELHRTAPEEVPLNPLRGGHPREAVEDLEEYARGIADPAHMDGILEVWQAVADAPAWHLPPVWLHADLHPANVVNREGALAGVLDFGELCAGDPATDLAAAWVLLPDGSADAFFAEYPADEATVLRARGWALLRSLVLIQIGRAGDQGLPGGKPTWKPAGEKALSRVLAPFP